MKEYTWKSSKGQIITLIAIATTTTKKEVINLDGDYFDTGKTITNTEVELVAIVDGKKIAKTDSDYQVSLVPGQENVYWIPSLGKIAFTNEVAKRIEKMIEEEIKNSKQDKTTVEIINTDAIRKAKEIIFKVEKANIKVVAAKDYMNYIRGYNNLHNEGGEGFTPEVITQEEYNEALAILN